MSLYSVEPKNVRESLAKRILVDGFHVTIDLQRSHGSWIVDAESGQEILDCYSYFASLPLGHNHPDVVGDGEFMAALTRAAIANPANSDIYTTEYAAFVEAFSRWAMPEAFKYLFFVAGGALAVENALKTAFDWKVRLNRRAHRGDMGTQVVHFREAFHGRSGYTMSLTNTDPVKTDAFPKFNWPRISNPKLSFPLNESSLEQTIALEKQAVVEIEEAFARHGHDIAAIIIEPIQGEGGDNHFRAEFFKELRRLADQHEALLIFDEVQTGVGLTGKLWAYQHFGVTPDILVFGKKTQVCGIMVGERIDKEPENVFRVSGRLNSTWGGNLVDMVRAVKYLEIIHRDHLVEHAAAMGDHFISGLASLATRYPLMSNVRGRGMFLAFTLPSTELRNQLRKKLWERGLASLTSGPCSIRFRPPLTFSKAEVDTALQILDAALAEI